MASAPLGITTINAVASSTTTIPLGARDVGIILQTGTGTLGGVAMTALLPYNFIGPLQASCDVALANPGTANISYTI